MTAYRTVRAAPPPAADPRGDQDRRVRRGLLHLVVDGAQPGRHRRQAARPHDRRRASARRPPRRRASSACGSTCSPRRPGCPRWSTRWPRTPPRLRAEGALPPAGRRRPAAGSTRPGARTRRQRAGFERCAQVAPVDRPRRPHRAVRWADAFPTHRPRRLRRTPALRRLVAETDAAPAAPRPADVRQGGRRRAGADRVDARRRPAHPRLAAQGRRRGGRRPASAG